MSRKPIVTPGQHLKSSGSYTSSGAYTKATLIKGEPAPPKPRKTEANSSVSLSKYRLRRAALDLQTFTVEDLVRLTQAPENTVYGFVRHLGSGVAKEAVPSSVPGRPRLRYSLNSEGVEQLLDENLAIAGLLRAEGMDPAAVRDPSRPNLEVTGRGTQSALAREPEASPETDPAADSSLPDLELNVVYELVWQSLSDLCKAERAVIHILPRVSKEASNKNARVFLKQIERREQENVRLRESFEKLAASRTSDALRSGQVEAEERAGEHIELLKLWLPAAGNALAKLAADMIKLSKSGRPSQQLQSRTRGATRVR